MVRKIRVVEEKVLALLVAIRVTRSDSETPASPKSYRML